MSKANFKDYDWAFYPNSYLWNVSPDCKRGVVSNEHGHVTTYTSTSIDHKSGKAKYWTRLQFIRDGRTYSRTFDVRLTELGISRLANKFARDVVARLGAA